MHGSAGARRLLGTLGVIANGILLMRLTTYRQVLFGIAAVGLFQLTVYAHAACNIVGGKAYGDCDGVRVIEGTKGRLTVRSYTAEASIIRGATILRGGALDLSGVSNGDITVHQGGRLRLTGVINGTVENLGGTVEVEGMLNHLHTTGGQVTIGGSVGSVSGQGTVSYKKGSLLGGVPIEKAFRKGGSN